MKRYAKTVAEISVTAERVRARLERIARRLAVIADEREGEQVRGDEDDAMTANAVAAAQVKC